MFASLCTHVNCGNQLFFLINSPHRTVAYLHCECNCFSPRHSQCSHNHNKSMWQHKAQNSHLKWCQQAYGIWSKSWHISPTMTRLHLSVCAGPHRNNWPVSTGRLWLLSPFLTAAQPQNHKCGSSKNGETWRMKRFPFCFSPLTCSDPWAPRAWEKRVQECESYL